MALTCTYSEVQQAVALGLSALPLVVLLRGVLRVERVHLLAAVGLAVKGAEDLAATCACQLALLSSGIRTAVLLGKAAELSLLCIIMLLCAKGLGVFRCGVLPSERHLLVVISVLVCVAWISFLLASDILHLGLIIDLAALFCITTKSLLESQLILRSLLPRLREKAIFLHNFQRYFACYYAVLTLRWVCVPISYLPLLPDLTLYIWLGLGLQAAELAAVLPVLGHLLTNECVDVQCTEEEAQLPLYVPAHCTPSCFPVLVLTPGLKVQRCLGEEIN